MALTRLSNAVLNDGRIALYHLQLTKCLRRHTDATVATHNCLHTNHWRKQNQQPQCRTYSHLTGSHDFVTNNHMIACTSPSHRTSLRMPAHPPISVVSIISRRCIHASATRTSRLFYIPSPVEFSYEFLEHIHGMFSLPWWVTILATTFLLRGVIVFPFSVWQQKVLARIENVQPEINTHAEHIKQQVALMAKDLSWSQKEMANMYSQQVKEIIRKLHFHNKCHSSKIFYVGLVQIGLWSSFTMAIGQMTGKYTELFSAEPEIDFLPELTTQGALWFSDLTQTDLLIPVMLGLVNLALVEMWSLRRGPLTLLQHRLVNWFRLVSLGMIPIATMMPAAVSFYWLSSSLAGLGQFMLLRWPAFRRLVQIPPSPSEMKHPLQEMRRAFKVRYFSKKVF